MKEINYLYPVNNFKLTRGFGANPEYYAQYGQRGHNGVDLGVSLNAEVKASRDGVVRFSGHGRDLYYVGAIAGNYVLIDHGDVWTGYAHNNKNLVKEGQSVKQGETIALAGKTGDASGVHVHWEFIFPANPVTNENGYYGRVNPNEFNLIKEQNIMMSEDGVRYSILGVTGGVPMPEYEEEVRYWTGRDSTEFGRYLYKLGDYYMVKARKDNKRLTKELSEATKGFVKVNEVYRKA